MAAVTLDRAKILFKGAFVGPQELRSIAKKFPIDAHALDTVGDIPYDESTLRAHAQDHVLFYGIPTFRDGSALNLLRLKETFGTTGDPCFYPQDWYLGEAFANACTLRAGWHLLGTGIRADSRGKLPETNASLPSALTCAYAFFAVALLTGRYLWESDFVWCSDRDGRGDPIYVGRYRDPLNLSKSGFNVHRHLLLRDHFGSIGVGPAS